MTKCVICGSEIMREWNGWDGGHNAEPVKEGRCCAPCNYTIVVPTRIRMVYARRQVHPPGGSQHRGS
jgi:hypothetical protein